MHWLIIAGAVVAAAYQLVALVASLARWRQRVPRSSFTPRVSILKPIHGAGAGFAEAIGSNLRQQYPDFELLAGVADMADAAVPILRAQGVRVIHTHPVTPNRKAGSLIELAAAAKGEVLVVSDADIHVPAGWLRDVVAPLADPAIGLVTCVYRARAETWPARFEALGVATDFGPSTMVAPFVGVDEFGLGSTLVIRRADLDRIGGFLRVADYLADDYQLGHAIHGLGLRCVLSPVVVETHLSAATWRDVWRHQVRWARTIRVSRPGGYAGIPVTNATAWAVACAAVGALPLAAGLMLLRMTTALVAGYAVLGAKDVLRLWWLIPARDLFALVVWAAGLVGWRVEWGGEQLALTSDGKIVSTENHRAVQ